MTTLSYTTPWDTTRDNLPQAAISRRYAKTAWELGNLGTATAITLKNKDMAVPKAPGSDWEP